MTDYTAIANQALDDYPEEILAPLVKDNPDFDDTLMPLFEHFWKVIVVRPFTASILVSKWHIELAYAMGYAYGREGDLREMFEDE